MVGCELDLHMIASQGSNVVYDPLRKTVFMRIREPCTTAKIFANGRIVCKGAKSEEDSRLAARKYARIIQKLGFNVSLIFSFVLVVTRLQIGKCLLLIGPIYHGCSSS